MKHQILALNKNADTVWTIEGLTREQAETEAENKAFAYKGIYQIFISCAKGYLNKNGYSCVGNSW